MKTSTFARFLPALCVPWLVSCASLDAPVDNETGGLKKISAAELRDYLLKSYQQPQYSAAREAPAGMPAPAAAAPAAAKAPAFSTTNLQERGVDEADLIKTDGRHVYAIGAPNNQHYQDNTLRIMQINDGGKNLQEVKRLTLPEGSSLQNLYLAGKQRRLVTLGNAYQAIPVPMPMPAGTTRMMPPPYIMPRPQQTELNYIDVRQPEKAASTLQVQLGGDFNASRRVGDTLYLVLQSYPQINTTSGLDKLTAQDFLPTYRTADGKTAPLVTADDCYVNRPPKTADADSGYYSNNIISVVAVDLNATDFRFKSRCYVGNTDTLYASPQALYLATTDYQYNQAQGARSNTRIHKFAFTSTDIAYRGSGSVPGHLSGQESSFRFSEQDGYLRVITENDQFTDPSMAITAPYGKSPGILSILKEGGNNGLQLVSQLPNRKRPQHIGKPEEQLYASRFVGDQAYLITFRSTDPLYVLDLTNPQDPYIAGELQIPGFSDYLHPVGKHLLLGIGKDALPDPQGEFRGAWYQGMKLSLFDTSKPGEMKEVDKLILGKRGTDSAALHDHHAVTTLPVGTDLRVALPIKLHDTPQQGMQGQPSDYYDHTQTGLYRFEVDKSAKKIRQLAPLITERGREEYWSYPQNDRSVMIGDYVHYFHNGNFWSQRW
ncbi:beta-propeller domain-containing protein [Thiothrix subterranea]|uniref:Beta-propeller domain-containing protein n=1 Tax=Thiothrix subterranea TaxID=2735563 RepID=A0AA51R0U8_9GAMM|nr:beta-propeller domain-containing protein [Thiothrix subterranea]MDQ5769039.1 beta-propeller domain-containing protein [Thiothrix subterranea]WML88402.1 beta-propeller domain-containing protein [Thiothrix subterranea]